MRFFEKIREKHEDKILAKAKTIEEKRLIQEQARQAEIEHKEQEIQKLLNSSIPKEFVIELHRSVEDENGRFMYIQYDYFLCDKRIRDLYYGDRCKAIKVTGSHLGEKFDLSLTSLSSLTTCELYINCECWEGDIAVDLSLEIPDNCFTIADLNNYANVNNQKIKREYEQKVLTRQQKEQTIQNQFFK